MSTTPFSKFDLFNLIPQSATEELKQNFISYSPPTVEMGLNLEKLAILFPELADGVFKNEYFGKKHYLSKKNSWHSKYRSMDFMKDVSTHTFEKNHVHYSYSGKPVPHSEHGSILGSDIVREISEKPDFSFRVAPLYRYSNKAQVLLENVEFLEDLFGAEVGLLTFFSKNNESVIPPHWDTEDLIVCQLSGKKKWSFFDNKFKYPLREQKFGFDKDLCELNEKVLDEITLEEGDVLYLPKGLGHYAKAISGDSLHATYGIYHPSINDMMDYALKMTIEAFTYTAESRKSFNSHQFNQADFFKARERLVEVLKEVPHEHFLKCWPTQYRLFNDERFQAVYGLAIVPKSHLWRSSVRFHVMNEGSEMKLHTYGRLFEIPKLVHDIFKTEIDKPTLNIEILKENYSNEQVSFFWDFIQKLRIYV